MRPNWYLVFAYSLGVSFGVSSLLTYGIRRVAMRMGLFDAPGVRKMHTAPVPLLGGVAIVISFYGLIFGNLALLYELGRLDLGWFNEQVFQFLGEEHFIKLGGIFAGGMIIFIVGLVDDLRALSPAVKLMGQIGAAAVLALSGIVPGLFILEDYPFLGGLVTIVWVVGMMNAFNFLDNMDGLCGGVSIIAAMSYFLSVLYTGNTFVCVFLMVFVGSVAGFLYHNLSPARIFMGDAGSMFCGYILGLTAIIATFYAEGLSGTRLAVATPLIALSVPMFDTISVVIIRWRSGDPISQGDKRHLSHRLVDLGMSPRQAVEFIFLLAAVTGLSAALLPKMGWGGTMMIIGQVLGIFLLIVLLMSAGRAKSEE
jgi:UDP-GlcNAc:undecaprenyl-phosphate/decaprenyl-phosphate GlcNAc-1-phosphate transferase